MLKANYISVADFKAYHPDVDLSAYADQTVSGIISQASDYVDEFLNYTLSIETITNEESMAVVTTDGDLQIFPRKLPIQSVQGITLKLGQYNSTIPIIDGVNGNMFDVPNPGHYILFPYQQLQLTGKIGLVSLLQLRNRNFFTQLNYTAGYATIPQNIVRATALIVRDMLALPFNPAGASEIQQGGIRASWNDDDSRIMKEAKRILEKYVRRWEL